MLGLRPLRLRLLLLLLLLGLVLLLGLLLFLLLFLFLLFLLLGVLLKGGRARLFNKAHSVLWWEIGIEEGAAERSGAIAIIRMISHSSIRRCVAAVCSVLHRLRRRSGASSLRLMRLHLFNPSNPLVSIVRLEESRWNRCRVWQPLSLMAFAAWVCPLSWAASTPRCASMKCCRAWTRS
jgi:hypothetical protein